MSAQKVKRKERGEKKMLEIKVNNITKDNKDTKVEIRIKGTAEALLAELTLAIASLQRHDPTTFNKKAILLCVDVADKIKSDDEIEEEEE